MSNADLVVRFLEVSGGKGCCDDCIMKKTSLRPRVQVTRVCRALVDEGRILRKRGKCALGDHTKMLNSVVAQRARKRRPAVVTGTGIGIEGSWRYVDRFCRAVWNKHLQDEMPSSLADIITTLRDEELVPAHEANMMHTIRSLRNMVVHENPDFSEHETTIARAAWEIVRAWAENHEAEAWQLTVSVCGARAA